MDDVVAAKCYIIFCGFIDYHDRNGDEHTTAFKYFYDPGLKSMVLAADGNLAT